MAKLDSTGTYRGTIVESGLNITKTGKPQWVARLKAAEKFITEKADLEHFKLAEPAWVDWSGFDEDIVAFLLLFNSADVFDASTVMLNYDQLVAATGWDGQSFDALAGFAGKSIQFRVSDKKPYTNDQGKTIGEGQLEVSWIDAPDANPERALKTLAVDDLKALNAKLRMSKPKVAVATKPASAPAPAPAPAPAAPPKSRKKATPPAPALAVSDGLPAETDQVTAWDYVITHKGEKSDTDAQDAWMSACETTLGDRADEDATPKDWATIRDAAVAALTA